MAQSFGRPIWFAVGAVGAAAVMGSALVISQAAAGAILPAAHHMAAPARPVAAETVPAIGASAAAPVVSALGGASVRRNTAPLNPVPVSQSSRPAIDRCSASAGPRIARALPMCLPPAPQP